MEASSTDKHILVIDDDPRIRKLLVQYFEGEGYRVSAGADGEELRTLLQDKPDIVLLDLMLPGEDGLNLARHIRSFSDVPIIMLTGRNDVVDRIVGLEVGADDYIAKPFHLREVLARVRTVLRRRQPPQPAPTDQSDSDIIRFQGFELDIPSRRLSAASGEEIPLTTGEFDMLRVLASHMGHVFTRDTLMDLTRGREWDPYDRVIDTQIARLRRKIERDPKNPELIKSVRGVGYVFTGKAGHET